jgi:hypothetical protein
MDLFYAVNVLQIVISDITTELGRTEEDAQASGRPSGKVFSKLVTEIADMLQRVDERISMFFFPFI